MNTDFGGGPLSNASLRRASDDLGEHIRLGGNPNDEIGFELVQRFVRQLCRYSDFTIFASQWNLAVEDICGIVRVAILLGKCGILPTLFVKDSEGDILLGCVLVQKSSAIREIVGRLQILDKSDTDPRFDDQGDLFLATCFSPKTVQLTIAIEIVGKKHIDFIHSRNQKSGVQVSESAGGLPSLPDEQPSKGCLAMLMFGVASALSLGYLFTTHLT